jgi:hypothetical protein
MSGDSHPDFSRRQLYFGLMLFSQQAQNLEGSAVSLFVWLRVRLHDLVALADVWGNGKRLPRLKLRPR